MQNTSAVPLYTTKRGTSLFEATCAPALLQGYQCLGYQRSRLVAGSIPPCYKVTIIPPATRSPMPPCCKVGNVPCYKVTSAPCCKVTNAPCCKVANVPCCKVTNSPCCKVGNVPCCKVTNAPCCKVTNAPCCKVTTPDPMLPAARSQPLMQGHQCTLLQDYSSLVQCPGLVARLLSTHWARLDGVSLLNYISMILGATNKARQFPHISC